MTSTRSAALQTLLMGWYAVLSLFFLTCAQCYNCIPATTARGKVATTAVGVQAHQPTKQGAFVVGLGPSWTSGVAGQGAGTLMMVHTGGGGKKAAQRGQTTQLNFQATPTEPLLRPRKGRAGRAAALAVPMAALLRDLDEMMEGAAAAPKPLPPGLGRQHRALSPWGPDPREAIDLGVFLAALPDGPSAGAGPARDRTLVLRGVPVNADHLPLRPQVLRRLNAALRRAGERRAATRRERGGGGGLGEGDPAPFLLGEGDLLVARPLGAPRRCGGGLPGSRRTVRAVFASRAARDRVLRALGGGDDVPGARAAASAAGFAVEADRGPVGRGSPRRRQRRGARGAGPELHGGAVDQ